MNEFLYPLFIWPLLTGLVVGIGVTVRVYRAPVKNGDNGAYESALRSAREQPYKR